MAEVQKGKVTDKTDKNVRVSGGSVTPFLDCRGLVLAVGDTVAYVLFSDGTGFILAKM